MDIAVQGAGVASTRVERCDLCGSSSQRRVLASPRLDGPLVRCADCGLHYVADRPSRLAFGRESAQATSERLAHANRELAGLPRVEERRLNELNARWRLERIDAFGVRGRLLEVGCGRGDFLKVASERYEVRGVEPGPDLAAEASRVAPVHHGLVQDLPGGNAWADFDIAATFHVVEHVDSPSGFLAAIAGRLRPGGLLVLETPDIGSISYRLLGRRWRQFIPEHYYFFDRTTLTRLIEGNGFRIRLLEHVGKHASLALLLDRLGRELPWLRRVPAFVPGTIRINPRDVLLAIAVRES